MASVNKVILVGNLGRDPETRETAGGTKLTKFSVATSKKWKEEGKPDSEKTQWHNITCFGKLADLTAQYLKKGSSVYIDGEINYSTTEKDGVKKYFTDIVANSVQFLSKRETEASATYESNSSPSYGCENNTGSELPF
jgi:single-strand DNA-binding protein